ncbi:hypothetical protein Aca07nite_09410 [Actinoplanes capillaceus]|uniref:DUF4352 domain-containing protein n=1 Tax=Actinoplanes campanulatus TaxID=113559 RepID=A0ABQ3W9D6_9ACTN|nr:DUF4352 domain-containing protein [Actinoplanes capillaceus]GID43666.1 hypothetical protein Aca07nite_09410 [Actinoplanes capillaceus]
MSYPPSYQPQPGPGYPMPPQPGFPPPGPGQSRPPGGRRAALWLAGAAAVVTVGLVALTEDTGTTNATTTATQPVQDGDAAQPLQGRPGREEKTTEAAAETFGIPVGTTITHRDGRNVTTAVVRSVKAHREACNSLDVDPKQGMYVVVDVLVVQTKGKGSVNPLDFTFVADDGTSANSLSSMFSGCDDPSLDATDLRAGQKRAGKIAFDAGMKAGTIEWAPGGFGADTVGSWTTK